MAAVVQGSLPKVLTGIGELEATRQVMVTAEASGLITAIAFKPGQKVFAGQTLVQLNDAPERGELVHLQAQAVNSRARLDRSRRLLSEQAATQEQFDQAKADYMQVLGDIERMKALIAQKCIKAPFDGVLGVRKVNLGEFVHAGAAMVSLTDANTLFANIHLPERTLAMMKNGQDIQLTVDAYPGRLFHGKVTTIEPRIDSGTRMLQVQATVSNPDKALATGMYVNAQVTLPSTNMVLSVPETAISYNAFGDFVYVVQGADDQTSVHLVQVKTGQHVAGRVEVLEGISANDRVVTSGQLRLSNGAEVEIIPWDSVAVKASPAPTALP